MKILITGGSSFTGYWFIKELSSAGHKVYATFTKKLDDYTGIRKLRVDELKKYLYTTRRMRIWRY